MREGRSGDRTRHDGQRGAAPEHGLSARFCQGSEVGIRFLLRPRYSPLEISVA